MSTLTETLSTNKVQTCQNCNQNFTIEPSDFAFYEKMKVPPPTFCPDCRLVRRLVCRNMRSLYKRECGICHKSLISIYEDTGHLVFCLNCYNSDNWNQYMYAKSINWSHNFLLQFYELLKNQPKVYQTSIGTIINSDYGNAIANSKNSYLCFSSIDNEDVMYSENIDRCRNTLDCFCVQDLDQCSWNITSSKNYNSHFVISSHSCIDSYFLYDCVNCQNCCLSSNIRNQQYVFKNQKLSKELYSQAVLGLRLETYSGFESAKVEFNEMYRNSIHKYAQILSSQNATGDFISNSKNITNSFDVTDSSEDIKYGIRIIKSKEVFDCSFSLSAELTYECASATGGTYNQLFTVLCFGSKDIEYSFYCKNCSDCFGCVGLKNSQYCILNKQYTKEEYFKLVGEIKNYMNENPYVDKVGRIYKYGEFFPFEFWGFGYNETLALDYFPLSKEDAINMGYSWKDREKREYSNLTESGSLPDSTNDITEDILNVAIACPNKGFQEFQCTSAFKIISEELQFYKQKKLPMPSFCPNCRHYQRLGYKNLPKLYHRTCTCDLTNHFHGSTPCVVEFETTYAPKRPEKVYCEKCYQQEVI